MCQPCFCPIKLSKKALVSLNNCGLEVAVQACLHNETWKLFTYRETAEEEACRGRETERTRKIEEIERRGKKEKGRGKIVDYF